MNIPTSHSQNAEPRRKSSPKDDVSIEKLDHDHHTSSSPTDTGSNQTLSQSSHGNAIISSAEGDVEKQQIALADSDGPPVQRRNVSSTSSSNIPTAINTDEDESIQYKDNLVVFREPYDPSNPKCWSRTKRWGITVSMGMMTFVVTFASSIFSVAIEPVSKEYDCSNVVATLGVSLFLLGFVLGPVCFGPMSEVFGRRTPLFAGYFVFAVFQIPVAVARNLETIMLGRFLGGFAAAAPLAVVGGALADIWNPVERAYGVCAFAFSAFAGPVAGPIVGGFVTQSYLGWRWTAWLTLIMAALFGIIGLILIPETSAPRILQTRAKDLRFRTKNWALHAKADEQQVNARSILTVYLVRPFIMLFQEPILALMTAYMSFIYGSVFLLGHQRAGGVLTDLLVCSISCSNRIQSRSKKNVAGTPVSLLYHSSPSSSAPELVAV